MCYKDYVPLNDICLGGILIIWRQVPRELSDGGRDGGRDRGCHGARRARGAGRRPAAGLAATSCAQKSALQPGLTAIVCGRPGLDTPAGAPGAESVRGVFALDQPHVAVLHGLPLFLRYVGHYTGRHGQRVRS